MAGDCHVFNFSGVVSGRGGGRGRVLPYMGYIGRCRGIGYGFLSSRSLNRVSFFTLFCRVPGVVLR